MGLELTKDEAKAILTSAGVMDDQGKIKDAFKAILAPAETELVDKPAKFREIANGLADLYAKKNLAYGDSFGTSIKKYGYIAGLTRISDKFNRLETLITSAVDCGDEKLTDTLLDMAAYCIMLTMEINT